jgi:hypothetical protein
VTRCLDTAPGTTPDPAWPIGGAVVTNFGGTSARIAAHPQDGVAVGWFEGGDVHVQRVLANGAIAPGWPADGAVIPADSCIYAYELALACDDAGNVYVSWTCEKPLSVKQVRMARITSGGALAPGWPPGGVVVRERSFDGLMADLQLMLPCGSPSVLSWTETGTDYDVRVQRVSSDGDLQWGPEGVLVTNAPADQNSAVMTSVATCGQIAIAWLDDRNSPGGANDSYAARILSDGGVLAVPSSAPAAQPAVALSVRVVGANPSRAPAHFAVAVDKAAHVTAEVVDVAGRHQRTLSHEWRDSGPYTVDWDGRSDDGSAVAAGVYLVRVTAGGQSANTRVILLP